MISIEQIHSFVLVYQNGSYSAAARIAGKERSTVREHVVTLEDTLGVDLFQIEGRSAKPTDAAHKLISRAVNLSKQAQDFELTAMSLYDNPLSTLELRYDPLIPAGMLADAITAIKTRYPSLAVNCTRSTRSKAYNAIEDGHCHIALMATENSPRTQARIGSRYIGSLALNGYVHRNNPLAERESIAMDELRLHTQLELQSTEEGDLGDFRVSNVTEKAGSLILIMKLLGNGGWIVLSDHVANPWVEAGRLKQLNIADASRAYNKGVCLFFSHADHTREEVDFALRALEHEAGKYLS